MSMTARMLLWAVAAYFGFRLIMALVVLVQLLRLRLWPAQTQRLPELPDLLEDQAAALEELKALGFQPIATLQVQYGTLDYLQLILRHGSAPAFASLLTLPAGNIGYPVSFYSFAADGRLLLTSNRMAWAVFGSPPEVQRTDAYADSLAAHWQAHQARLNGAATATPPEDEAVSRIEALTTGYLPLLQAQGRCVQDGGTWHPSLGAAASAAFAWLRVSRKLARRYHSPLTGGAHQVAYYTHCYLAHEAMLANRPSRRRIKLAVLGLSIAAALALWGLMFQWSTALMLVGIVLVHECGHALAMRAYGYRDMSMFFIPFVGAIVTGQPKELPAWKQAVILLAGPMPGLLAGLGILLYGAFHPLPHGFDLRALAVMAVAINLFNLLPLPPLDGGQLMEISLFNRWPVSRLLFALFGACGIVALAIALKSPSMVFVALVLGLGMRSQFRVMRLQRAWRDGLEREAQIRNLFDAARRGLRIQTYAMQAALVKIVLARRTVRRARLWESALVIGLMLALWGTTGTAAWLARDSFGHHLHPVAQTEPVVPRSAAQVAFDNAYEFVDDIDEDDDRDDRDGPADPQARLRPLDELARQLEPDDPRNFDLRYRHVMYLQGDEQRRQMEALLAAHRDGQVIKASEMEQGWLDQVRVRTSRSPPAERAAVLSAAIERAMQLVPAGYANTVDARLRLAEAVDQSGDPAKAGAMLEQVHEHAANADDCRCALRRVVAAQARFDLTRHRAADAVTVLETSLFAAELKQYGRDLPTDYAFALLAAGRTVEGVEQMQRASLWLPQPQPLLSRMLGARHPQPRMTMPLRMAYAWHLAGQDQQIHSLDQKTLQQNCKWAAMVQSSNADWMGPWEKASQAGVWEFAGTICPAGENAAGGAKKAS